MVFFPRSEEEIVKDSLEKLRNNTRVTQLAPGGKVRFILETFGAEQADQNLLFDSNLLQPFIKYCDGRFLDYFGDMLNMPRYEATHGTTVGDNFFFYVDSGSFGDINGGSGFLIPSGTIINNPILEEQAITPGIEQQPQVTFTTTASVSCPSDGAFVYVSLRATAEGSESSVPRNVLTEHNFTGYSKSSQSLLKCTNRYSIDNGVARESDVSYRYRLQNAFNSKSFATYAAIRLAALSIPGVSDVSIVNCEQGPGTFTLYIDGIAPTVSPDLVTRVSEAVNAVTAEGIRGFITGHRVLGSEFILAVHWRSDATAAQKAIDFRNMRSYVEETLNDTRMGQELELRNLLDGIRSVTNNVHSFGRAKPNEFEQVYIYKTSPDGVGSVRNIHVGKKIIPLYNEKVLLETGNRYRGIQFISF